MKPKIAYAAVNKNGQIFTFTVSELRKEVVAKWERFSIVNWESYKKRYGLRIAKVEIREVTK